jgi:predicted kinase
MLIVCGLPFSGKSTMSRNLARVLDQAVHIDIDQINAERGLGSDGQAIPLSEWPTTYEIAYQRVNTALQSGRTAIFDATNYSRAQRDILRMKSRQAGAASVVVFVDVPESECRYRWLRNRETGERYDIRDEDYENVVSRFESPGAGEQVIVYLEGMKAEDLVSGLFQLFGQ